MSSEQHPISKDERNIAMLCHLAALSAMIGVPFGWVLGPLVVWLVKKNDYPFVDDQGKASVNFQISITVYAFILGLLLASVIIITGNLACIAAFMAASIAVPIIGGLMALFWLISVISGAVAASNGRQFRYPITIRFIK